MARNQVYGKCAIINHCFIKTEKTRLSSVVGDGGHGYFRLDQHSDQLMFATDEEIERNIRFQMLQLRKNKVPEFKNYRMIPASENEIPRGILEAREKRYLHCPLLSLYVAK